MWHRLLKLFVQMLPVCYWSVVLGRVGTLAQTNEAQKEKLPGPPFFNDHILLCPIPRHAGRGGEGERKKGGPTACGSLDDP